jgi:hypothetical protein
LRVDEVPSDDEVGESGECHGDYTIIFLVSHVLIATEEEDDDIAMPSEPPPGVPGEEEADSDDEIPLPEGPPLPIGPPPRKSSPRFL